MTHYHVFHNIPGYLPEGDEPEPAIADIRSAFAILSDELARTSEYIAESLDDAETEEESYRLAGEAQTVDDIARELERVAKPWAGTQAYPSTVKLYGEPERVDYIAAHGLTIEVDDGRALPTHFHLSPCDETECVDPDDDDEPCPCCLDDDAIDVESRDT